MQYLGIDYGKARIGLAISETGQIARPIGHIKNKGDAKNIAVIRELCAKHQIKYIVCGIPLDTGANETDMSREVRRFGEKLGIEVAYHNERYSSLEAEEYIREKMGITKREKVKELVDGVAAAMILQSYLDSRRNKK